jgi:hypothetical protein
VKVDLETKNIRLFQGERLSIIGIYYSEELEAFQIKRANGELIKLNFLISLFLGMSSTVKIA